MKFFSRKEKSIKEDFPILQTICYLDNACVTLKPKSVIAAMTDYYENYPACHGRSAHKLAKQVNIEVEDARRSIEKFINADGDIIFTKNTTESINLIANALEWNKNDVVIISDKEHNSNLIPWLKLQKEKGIIVKIVHTKADNTFDLHNLDQLIKECREKELPLKLISINHVSNIDGVKMPVKSIAKMAHSAGALCLIDGAQAAGHKIVDVQDIGCDFYAFSGHKMLGPSGMGVLYIKSKVNKKLKQFLVGGDTVKFSTYEDYEANEGPKKFEAGLQNYAGIIGLGQAAKYLDKIGLKKIQEHSIRLNELLTTELMPLIKERKLRIIGPLNAKLRNGIFNFYIPTMDSHEVAQFLDGAYNIAVRSGAHCVHSYYHARKIPPTVRVSFHIYNTEEDVKKFINALNEIITLNSH